MECLVAVPKIFLVRRMELPDCLPENLLSDRRLPQRDVDFVVLPLIPRVHRGGEAALCGGDFFPVEQVAALFDHLL